MLKLKQHTFLAQIQVNMIRRLVFLLMEIHRDLRLLNSVSSDRLRRVGRGFGAFRGVAAAVPGAQHRDLWLHRCRLRLVEGWCVALGLCSQAEDGMRGTQGSPPKEVSPYFDMAQIVPDLGMHCTEPYKVNCATYLHPDVGANVQNMTI